MALECILKKGAPWKRTLEKQNDDERLGFSEFRQVQVGGLTDKNKSV